MIVAQIMLGVFTGRFGGMIGVYITGGILSTAHMVGFISLMGIVVRNGIMLIDHYKHLYEVDKMPW
jgi:multidrug efflux pump subunit AcrB